MNKILFNVSPTPFMIRFGKSLLNFTNAFLFVLFVFVIVKGELFFTIFFVLLLLYSILMDYLINLRVIKSIEVKDDAKVKIYYNFMNRCIIRDNIDIFKLKVDIVGGWKGPSRGDRMILYVENKKLITQYLSDYWTFELMSEVKGKIDLIKNKI